MKKIIKRILKVLLCGVLFAALMCGLRYCDNATVKKHQSMLIERPNSALVVVKHNESDMLLGTQVVSGHMDLNDINAFNDDTLTTNVKVFHPYKNDEYILINADQIVQIEVLTTEEFVDKHPPD